MSNGWPLGLENMNTRLRVMENLQSPTAQPFSIHMPSTSFSSFTSSNLDTMSTVSFFQDHSVSLGILLGFKTVDRGGYLSNKMRYGEEHEKSMSSGGEVETPQGICLPLLLCVFCKMSTSRNDSSVV